MPLLHLASLLSAQNPAGYDITLCAENDTAFERETSGRQTKRFDGASLRVAAHTASGSRNVMSRPHRGREEARRCHCTISFRSKVECE
jgi:hypothetical protein